MLRGNQVPFIIKPITRAIIAKMEQLFFFPNMKAHFGFLEQQLATSPDGGEYLCGTELNAADILMSFPLIAALRGDNDSISAKDYPKLNASVTRSEGQPGYKTSIEKIEKLTGEKYEVL